MLGIRYPSGAGYLSAAGRAGRPQLWGARRMSPDSDAKVNIAGIVMVAPAEPSLFELDEAVLPERLRVPSLLFASRNDPLMTFKRAQYWAQCWGGRLIDLGDAGHINAESGFGEWNYGLEQLAEFCEGLPQFIKS